MKKFSMKQEPRKLEMVREELKNGNAVEVNNEFETFYGAGFDRWLREGLKDIPCDYKVTSWNKWCGYPWCYIITPKN